MENRNELTAEQTERLIRRLCIISDGISHGKQPEVTLTWRHGDSFRSAFIRVRKIDWPGRRLLPVKEREDTPDAVPFSEIIGVQSAVLELLEEPDGFLDFIE